jgi:hypothetical protein
MPSSMDEPHWIVDFCAGCNRLVLIDLMEQLCPECLGPTN